MSLAWGTVLLILLVMPGFAALFAFYTGSRSSRDATPKSASAELAIVVALAFVFHFLAVIALLLANGLYDLGTALANSHAPSWNDGMMHGAIDSLDDVLQQCDDKVLCNPISLVQAHPLTVVGFGVYLIAVTAAALFLALWLIRRLEGPWNVQIRFLHGWAGDFFVGDPPALITATVLTDISHKDLIVAYSGTLFDLHLNRERNIENLVLVNPQKRVFRLTEGQGLAEVKERPVKNLAATLFLEGKGLRNLALKKGEQEIHAPSSAVKRLGEVIDKRLKHPGGPHRAPPDGGSDGPSPPAPA